MSLETSLATATKAVHQSCLKAGRSPQEVRILAVSKLQPTEKVRSLAQAGQTDFGENYPQELQKKQSQLADLELRWHLIGKLQRNKVKFVLGRCHLIHSVDSLELAQELNKRAQESRLQQKILLQVNVAEEASKGGFLDSSLASQLESLAVLPHVQIQGLMTMPPFVENPEDNRIHFRKLKTMLTNFKDQGLLPPGAQDLSMGTSQDFQVAIEEGATWIRLGTSLFGDRVIA